MKIASLLAISLFFLQLDDCDQKPKPIAKERHYAPIHRFEHVTIVGSPGVALDTVTGQWCKTWEWAYKNTSLNGGLDTLPTCLSVYQRTPSSEAAVQDEPPKSK